MSEPFLSEIKAFGFNFAPRGWAQCDGQILPINQNQSLYSLLGTTYGGDGRTSFALPDLRGRVPLHFDSTFQLGNKGGEETHTLTVGEIPTHNHTAKGTSDTQSSSSPDGTLFAALAGGRRAITAYEDATSLTAMNTNALAATPSQSHENMQPYLALNFCIAIQGLFPSRN